MIVVPKSFVVEFVPATRIAREADILLKASLTSIGEEFKSPIPIETILEGYLDLALDFDDLTLTNGVSDVLAATFMNERVVTIQNSLVPETGGNLGQYRFTIAHEIGHWILHRKYFLIPENQTTLFNGIPQPDIVCRGGSKRDPAEIQADKFAAELLMPRDLIVKHARQFVAEGIAVQDSIAPMATTFEVSKQAMSIRFDTLGLIQKNLSQAALGL